MYGRSMHAMTSRVLILLLRKNQTVLDVILCHTKRGGAMCGIMQDQRFATQKSMLSGAIKTGL